MIACSCSNPSCMVNGCQVANKLREQYGKTTMPHGFGSFTPMPLNEEDIRRIIREEIARGQRDQA
jgi:hypothetical protein